MRKAIHHLRTLLLDFIEQRDDLMLVIACPPAEAALLLNLLQGQQRERKDDLYYLFADDFTSSKECVETIVQRLKTDHDAAIASNDDTLPALPAALQSPGAAPLAGFHAALDYARGLVPPEMGHRIVWGFGPAEIANVADFAALLGGCLPHAGIASWMRGLRMIVRVPEDFPETDPLAQGPRVRFQRFVIPPDAAENEMRETVQNAKQPDAERIAALLQLSFIDAAHDRLPQASAGFSAALAWFQKTNEPGMQALAMIGLGDCSRRAKDLDKAKYWFECAIQPAGEEKQLICLSMIAQHLAAIAFERQQYEDAVEYYEQLVTLKRAIPDEDGLVEALLWRGRAQEKAKQTEPALASAEEAILICKTFELAHREEECLKQLKQSYIGVGRAAAGDQVVAEWKAV